MHYHILLTEKCNLRCRYCYEKSMCEFDNSLKKKFTFDYSDPEETSIKTSELNNFLKKDNDPVLIFYGGEPLLKKDKIIKIIDSQEDMNIRYRMQTNAILLDTLDIHYLKKIDKILVSLDGDKQKTDYNRGKGTYDKIIDNIRKAREEGYDAEIVARMTISQESPDIFKQVMHLKTLIDQEIIDSIHWQLDAGFYSGDFEKEKIESFFNRYNKSNKRLIEWWIKKIEKGKVYKIYPYIGIIKPLLENKRNLGLRCGAGHSGYAITTSGKIVACPIMNNIKDFEAGDIRQSPERLKRFSCEEECKDCEVYGLCQGRCMYWRKTRLWPKEGDELICNSIKEHIKELEKNKEKIEEKIKYKTTSKQDFDYEEYFGPEIIP